MSEEEEAIIRAAIAAVEREQAEPLPKCDYCKQPCHPLLVCLSRAKSRECDYYIARMKKFTVIK